MASRFPDASTAEVDAALNRAQAAFQQFRQRSLKERAHFLHLIAQEMKQEAQQLIRTASEETHLPADRLQTELDRTIFQLRSYGDACAQGAWLDVRIDRKEGSATLRKMLVPLGPVVVFGASNFPFAYSTAGGDTACALAAGCPVLLKAHPAHAATSELVASAVQRAAKECGLPADVFIHIHGAGFGTGQALVQHPLTKAVGFTGSFEGGKALFDLANARPVPIPVFAEMGSVNPVFILAEKLKRDAADIAAMYAASVNQSVGQFCTNPGILVAIESEALADFESRLGAGIAAVAPALMLHPGIARNFHEKRKKALAQKGVRLVAESKTGSADESMPTLASVPASVFIQDPLLHKEVFGPFSLLVKCRDAEEMMTVARSMEGQLTVSLMATEEEAADNAALIGLLREICGRMVYNGVPTGVTVALSMHHGGPYPATTDSRFTAVGADGIRRFARPVCYQGWPNQLLPPELQDENPLKLWRTVNDQLTQD